MWSPTIAAVALTAASAAARTLPVHNTTYTNPMLPGWHSDPSCVYVDETFFCVTSTFIAYPGLPLYASKDLQNWERISNIFNRPSQIPDLAATENQQGGIYAPTLRHRNGLFYLNVAWLGSGANVGLVFTSPDPYDETAWSEPVQYPVHGIDPDLFWDDDVDGQLYVSSSEDQEIKHYTLDLETGDIGPVTLLWNGTGGVWPEGPHIFKRDDGYYYLLIAEGGTETNHSSTMARSRHRTGPWEPCPYNPVLTARNTPEYFQTVGHADLFQDGSGNWWAVALSTRSGADWLNYPMGRETILTPAVWEEGEFPVIQPVRGLMQGPLPPKQPVQNPVKAPEHLIFPRGSSIPKSLMYWRLPEEDNYVVSPKENPNTLRLTPSLYGLSFNTSHPTEPITFLARRQTDTLFTYRVDLEFNPKYPYVEAGISLFLTQEQHIDLSIVDIVGSRSTVSRVFQMKVVGQGNWNGTFPLTQPGVPESWSGKPITLSVQAVDDQTYVFSAALAGKPKSRMEIGKANAKVLSAGTGPFTGTLVGVYATRNEYTEQDWKGWAAHGGKRSDLAYFGNWRYEGQGQEIDYGRIVPSY